MLHDQDRLDTMLAEKDELIWKSPEWFQQLKEAINHLIESDFPGLVQILYRIDVSETRVRQSLQQSPQEDAATLLAEIIVNRMLQTISTRKAWQQKNAADDIADEEKW